MNAPTPIAAVLAARTWCSDAAQARGACFNRYTDGEEDALFAGSLGGAAFEGVLPEASDYRITVYLMRNAARRNAKAAYRLTLD